jgi:hypothetical protein
MKELENTKVLTFLLLCELGGKVIFLHPTGKNYTLYYAHLDEQSVISGATVKLGDTVGLVGKTGNAIHTSPHLHFGIYTSEGAVDPLPFVNPEAGFPGEITASLKGIGKKMRTTSRILIYQSPLNKAKALYTLPENTIVDVTAATEDWYKAISPAGITGFIKSNKLTTIENPLRVIRVATDLSLLDRPDSGALRKMKVQSGDEVHLLGVFEDFYFVSTGENSGWIKKI